jgi:hypothetical protein
VHPLHPPRLAAALARRVAPLPPPTPRKARFETHQAQVGHVAPFLADDQLHAVPRRNLAQGQNQSPFLSRGPDAAHTTVQLLIPLYHWA